MKEKTSCQLNGERSTIMPSLTGRWLHKQLKLVKPILKRLDISEDRALQDRLGELGAKALKSKVRYENVQFAHFEAEWTIPVKVSDKRGILYLHGGGYTVGSLGYARGFGSLLAVKAGQRTLCVAYRLAPENKFPAALEDALCAYEHMLKNGYTPGQISIVGESAGGGLAFCLIHALKARNTPLPACVIGISPWTDLTFSGCSYETNRENDPTLSEESLRYYADLYAEIDVKNPMVSPIYGDLSRFPPSLLFAGEDELLLDDALMLYNRLIESGSACELHTARGMWHVYVLYNIREAKNARERIMTFIDENTR